MGVTPILYDTTNEARERFHPEERGCYFEGELELRYLPKSLYRYDISNCLFEATYEKVLEICQCTPYFHWAGLREYRNFCRGSSLICMNEVFSRIGEYNHVRKDNVSEPTKCLASCQNQDHDVRVTTSRLPNRQTFIERPEFCLLVEKLQGTCYSWKKMELDIQYPSLCPLLLKAERKWKSELSDENEDDNSTISDLAKTTLCQSILKSHNIFAEIPQTQEEIQHMDLLDNLFK